MAAAATDVFTKVGAPGTATTLSAPGHLIGGTALTVVSTANWPTTTGVIFAMDTVTIVDGEEVRDVGSYTEWEGVVASGTSITGLVLRLGTDQDYPAGVTTRVYIPVAASQNDRMVDGLIVDHDQSGRHKNLTDANGNEWIKQTATTSAVNEVTIANAATSNGPTISATGDDTNIDLNIRPKGTGKIKPGFLDGWSYSTLPSVSSVTNNGNRSYDITFGSTVASYLTPGMRIRTTRTVAAPTQCTSLNGTTQYFSKTTPNKLTFTDDFVASAWVKLTSYPASNLATIVSRVDAATPTNGWRLGINTSGQVFMQGVNAGATNQSNVTSYQSIPLNRWVHVAAQLDMSTFTATTTTSYTMIDGVDVPAAVSRTGTNPVALVQSGDLNIGAAAGGGAATFFPGKIAQVAVFNAKVTQATMRTYVSQGLVGTETSLASAYSFNNSITDLNTTTPNDLTAQGSAAATNADSPFSIDATGTPGGSYDYAIVTKVATTVATVQVPEGCTIPTSGGVTTIDLSAYKSPFGFPTARGRWAVEYICRVNASQSAPVTNTYYNLGSTYLTVPVGDWYGRYEVCLYLDVSATSADGDVTLSTTNNSETDGRMTCRSYINAASSIIQTLSRSRDYSITAATPYYLNAVKNGGTLNNITYYGSSGAGLAGSTIISFEPAHL